MQKSHLWYSLSESKTSESNKLLMQASAGECSGAVVSFFFDLHSPGLPRLAKRPLSEQATLLCKVLAKQPEDTSVLN